MRASRLLQSLLLAGATLGAACGAGTATHHTTTPAAPAGSPAGAAPPADEQLFVRLGGNPRGRVAVLSAAGGTVVRELPDGVPSLDWSTLYAVEPSAGTPPRSVLRAVAVASGATVHEQSLDGTYALPPAELDGTPGGLSPNGRWLALVDASPGGYAAGHSRFVVLDTAFVAAPKRVALDGTFWFDALSDDGSSLFLIERPGPDGSLDYRVRRYDLGAGVLDPRVVVEKGGPEQMRGTRISSVAAPAGDRLYSLYTNGPDGVFIHALTLSGPFAVCIDLPNPSAPTPTSAEAQEGERLAWSLALSAGGSVLYAVNGASGQVVVIDLNSNAVRRSAMLSMSPHQAKGPLGGLLQRFAPAHAAAKQLMHGGAALSPDGQTLYAASGDGVLAIDTVTLKVRAHLLGGQAVAGLQLSPDGMRLYALPADGKGVPVLHAASGRLLTRLQTPAQVQRLWQVR